MFGVQTPRRLEGRLRAPVNKWLHRPWWGVAMASVVLYLLVPGPAARSQQGTQLFLPILQNKQPASGPVEVLSNHSTFVTGSNEMHIVGEVENNTSQNLTELKLRALLYTEDGELLPSPFLYLPLGNLAIEDRTCFAVIIKDPPTNWTRYELEAPTYSSDGHPPRNMVVTNIRTDFLHTPNSDLYQLLGEIRNIGDTPVGSARAVATLYDVAGTVIDCGFAFPSGPPGPLQPGGIGPFTITFAGANYGDVATYRVQVDGD